MIPLPASEIDKPEDWREQEYSLRVITMRQSLQRGTWPPWLSASGPDWMTITLVIDGVPTGPALTWPNALLVASWLVETR